MTGHKVRRLPVIDGHDLIGVITQADIAANISRRRRVRWSGRSRRLPDRS
jgi:CBS domain-containing protein